MLKLLVPHLLLLLLFGLVPAHTLEVISSLSAFDFTKRVFADTNNGKIRMNFSSLKEKYCKYFGSAGSLQTTSMRSVQRKRRCGIWKRLPPFIVGEANRLDDISCKGNCYCICNKKNLESSKCSSKYTSKCCGRWSNTCSRNLPHIFVVRIPYGGGGNRGSRTDRQVPIPRQAAAVTKKRACGLYVYDLPAYAIVKWCRHLMRDCVYEGIGGVRFVRIRPGTVLQLLYPRYINIVVPSSSSLSSLSMSEEEDREGDTNYSHLPSRHSKQPKLGHDGKRGFKYYYCGSECDRCAICGGTYRDHLDLWWSQRGGLYRPFDRVVDAVHDHGVVTVTSAAESASTHSNLKRKSSPATASKKSRNFSNTPSTAIKKKSTKKLADSSRWQQKQQQTQQQQRTIREFLFHRLYVRSGLEVLESHHHFTPGSTDRSTFGHSEQQQKQQNPHKKNHQSLSHSNGKWETRSVFVTTPSTASVTMDTLRFPSKTPSASKGSPAAETAHQTKKRRTQLHERKINNLSQQQHQLNDNQNAQHVPGSTHVLYYSVPAMGSLSKKDDSKAYVSSIPNRSSTSVSSPTTAIITRYNTKKKQNTHTLQQLQQQQQQNEQQTLSSFSSLSHSDNIFNKRFYPLLLPFVRSIVLHSLDMLIYYEDMDNNHFNKHIQYSNF